MKTVLFICVHNAGRSQMAEAFFNHIAGGKARAISAGSQPADEVNPVAAQAMKEAGLDISRNKPKLLTLEMMKGVDRAVTMGCGDVCPVTTVQTDDWDLEDPKDKPLEEIRRIRDEIKERVNTLIDKVNQEGCMKSSLVELKNRVQETKNRSEVLKLREDISKFMESPQFEQLSEKDKDFVMDLLAKVHSKEEQYKGCDPLNCVSRPGNQVNKGRDKRGPEPTALMKTRG